MINIAPNNQFTNLQNISFSNIVALAINFLLIITAIILFFILIGGGVAVIVSGGKSDSKGSARGQQAVTGALIGLLIVFGAWAIMTLLGEFFGIDLLHLTIP